MGREEIEVIVPVLDRLRGEGMTLLGPRSADTLFHPAARARYDAAVCMYHDQALIPIKTIDFDGGVNVTLGLDIVRTSPDHGTAFDIAARAPRQPVEPDRRAAARARHGPGAARRPMTPALRLPLARKYARRRLPPPQSARGREARG